MSLDLKKMSLLALSFMLVTPFSVSAALPAMLNYYEPFGYSAAQVELLFSLSSLTILAVLLLNPWLKRLFTERRAIMTGLLFISLGGILPALNQSYSLVFCSRILLGFGVGIMNAHAINVIGHYYHGKERTVLLGWRGSVEVFGTAAMTFVAGQLLAFGWPSAFWIYAFALVILGAYLLFVPKTDDVVPEKTEKPTPLNQKQLLYLSGLAAYAGFVILLNTTNTLRIPVLLVDLGIGTESQASLILTAMMLMGIVAGIFFSQLLKSFGNWFMVIIAIVLGLGMLLIGVTTSIWLIALGAVVTGLVYSLGVTVVFHKTAETIDNSRLNSAIALVLVGCNLGGGLAAFVLQIIAKMLPGSTGAFLVTGWASLLLALCLVPSAIMGKKTV